MGYFDSPIAARPEGFDAAGEWRSASPAYTPVPYPGQRTYDAEHQMWKDPVDETMTWKGPGSSVYPYMLDRRTWDPMTGQFMTESLPGMHAPSQKNSFFNTWGPWLTGATMAAGGVLSAGAAGSAGGGAGAGAGAAGAAGAGGEAGLGMTGGYLGTGAASGAGAGMAGAGAAPSYWDQLLSYVKEHPFAAAQKGLSGANTVRQLVGAMSADPSAVQRGSSLSPEALVAEQVPGTQTPPGQRFGGDRQTLADLQASGLGGASPFFVAQMMGWDPASGVSAEDFVRRARQTANG